MKKKIFSFLIAMFLILPCMLMAACGSKPPASSGGGAGGSGGNGGNSGGPGSSVGGGEGVNTISKMYDLQVVSLSRNLSTSKSNETLARLPDGKILAIDVTGQDLFELEVQLRNLVNTGCWVDDQYEFEIDYFICTTPELYINMDLFRSIKVKNFYRPNMELDIAQWYKAYQYTGDLSCPYTELEPYFDAVVSLPEELLTGRPKQYYDGVATGSDTNSPYYCVPYYDYNWFYLSALAVMHTEQGTNIVLTTDDNDITSTFSYQGNTYSYTIDFTCPEVVLPDLNMQNMMVYKPDPYIPNRGGWEYPENPEQYVHDGRKQAHEYKTIVGLTYGDFDMLYIHEPTYNVFKGFLKVHDPNKKYEVVIATHNEKDALENGQFSGAWKDNFNEYKYQKDIYIMGLLMDKNKIDSNILIMREKEFLSFWNNATNIYKYVLEPYDPEQAVLKLENCYKSNHSIGANSGSADLPVLMVKRNGEFWIDRITETEGYDDTKNYALLCPSLDGVREASIFMH